MKIENFVRRSEGNWLSMRSGHSLAFQQFEEIVSNLKIQRLQNDDAQVRDILVSTDYKIENINSPFVINWEAESDWESNSKNSKGKCLIVPVENSVNQGIMLRSSGYIENIQVITKYNFTNDDTLKLFTNYSETIAKERIWFISENVRCRSSVLLSKSNSILQTSFASEIRKL